MSYEINVNHVKDSGDGFSVEVKVEGEVMAHTFPKGEGWMKKTYTQQVGTTHPTFVLWFIEKYKEEYEETQDLMKQREERREREQEYVNESYEVDL